MNVYNLRPLKKYLHIFQLEEYQTKRLVAWLLRTLGKKPKEVKKDIVWTNKAKFLYFSSLLLFLVVSWGFVSYSAIHLSTILIIILWLNNYVFIILSAFLLKIYEVPNKIKTIKTIRQKIDSIKNIKIIGITGSAGKTSTKNILSKLLSKKVLSTPLSFNTLFGISKVIDYELNNYYDYFITEMGAYKKGDIRELCKMTPPDVSILTTINTQHLERFRSLKNTINAKFEILQCMKRGGVGIVNLDNPYIRENLDKAKVKLIGYSINNNSSQRCKYTLKLTSWKIQNNKTHFQILKQGKKFNMQTNLLGKHHLSNLLAAIACAIHLGENLKNITKKVQEIDQIPHRLELKTNNNITILDDTYSSNIEGFQEALNVLNTFKGKKILVTPGIVELGNKTKQLHEMLGAKIANICDEVILVGKSQRTESIKNGLLSNKFKPNKITFVHTNKQVQKFLAENLKDNDIVLLENDLPDQYL